MTANKSDPIISILSKLGPLSSFQMHREMWQRHKIGRNTCSKRLERLFKRGKIGRYLRLEKGAYLYYLPRLHSVEILEQVARKDVMKYSRLLGRILTIVTIGKVLSIFELSRLANTNFFKYEKEFAELINKIMKLGLRIEDSFLVSPSLKKSRISTLLAHYKASVYEEAYLLALARRLFITKKKAKEMTLYRQPNVASLAKHKFDMFGHGGRKNQIKIIVECNLRRRVTKADLEGFSQRIGGTIKRALKNKRYSAPIARYYIANDFSDEAMVFAARRDKGIRLLYASQILSGILGEIQPYLVAPKRKPLYYGRFKEAKGIAFEAEIEPAFSQKGFKTTRRRRFFLDGMKISDKDTGKSFTDIDLLVERTDKKNQHKREILLIECKSGNENLTRKELFRKTKRYFRVAGFLKRLNNENDEVKIVVIANVDQQDKEEISGKSEFPMVFLAPSDFYHENRKLLKGAPRWLFGL